MSDEQKLTDSGNPNFAQTTGKGPLEMAIETSTYANWVLWTVAVVAGHALIEKAGNC